MRRNIFCALAWIFGIYITALQSQSTTRDEIDLYFYNRVNSSIPYIVNLGGGVLSKCLFDEAKRTLFITHGWTSNSRTPLNLKMKDALLNKDDVTVVMVDWEVPASAEYLEAVGNVHLVGKYVGDFIQNMSWICNYPLSNVGLIGHSLGAHVSGIAGSETNGSVGYIIGLDPAGPLFPNIFPNRRLSKNDAQYVEAIHTSAIGILYPCCHSDFYPNGGALQPACDIKNISCSHDLSNDYEIESIYSNKFISTKCDSYMNFVDGICADGDTAIMGGIIPDFTALGTYYLKVNSKSPYALG